MQNACVTDRTLAPRGMSTLYMLLPVTHDTGSIDWQREQPRFRALAIKQMEKIGITDVESRIRTEKILTPQDWNGDYGLYRGATFAMAHSLRQMLHMRPHNRFEETDGVYLAGGGTHPGSGLPVIFESARISAKLMLEDMGVKSAWNFGQSAFDQSHLQDRDLAVQ